MQNREVHLLFLYHLTPISHGLQEENVAWMNFNMKILCKIKMNRLYQMAYSAAQTRKE